MNDKFGETKKVFTFEELLRFYQDNGIDIALAEQPINRLVVQHNKEQSVSNNIGVSEQKHKNIKTTEKIHTPSPAQGSPKAVINRNNKPIKAAYISLDDQVKLARDIALSAHNLDDLQQKLLKFDVCPLKITAKNTCFADGNVHSKLIIIGDMPERDEDLQGVPFVGQSGELLNKMIKAIGYSRNDVYITNIIPWRPPGNREPTQHELELCKPFVMRQIELTNADVILALGGMTTRWLLGVNDSILQLRGNWLTFKTQSEKKVDIMPTLHPRYLLRNPAHKKFAWQDLLNLKDKINSLTN